MDTFFTFIKTRKQALLTSVAKRNTNVTSSSLFSSRLPRIITQQWQWTVQPHMVGTEHGVRELSGGDRTNIHFRARRCSKRKDLNDDDWKDRCLVNRRRSGRNTGRTCDDA